LTTDRDESVGEQLEAGRERSREVAESDAFTRHLSSFLDLTNALVPV